MIFSDSLSKIPAALKLLLAALALCQLSACALNKRVGGELPTTFLEDVDITSKNERLPFKHVWIKEGVKRSQFDSLYFSPIRVDKLPREQWRNSASTKVSSEAEYMAVASEIATFFRKELIASAQRLSAGPGALKVVDQPGKTTLVVQIVLTELQLSHPISRAASLAVPIPGTGVALGALSDPHLAFAARLTAGVGGPLVATAADRKFAPTRLIDLNKLTVSSSAREISAIWAKSIAEAIQGDLSKKVGDKTFDLLPW